jgi:hypothetical protein
MREAEAESLRKVLGCAAPLRASSNPALQVVGERLAVIVVDTMLELDPEYDGPWDDLLVSAEGSSP